MKHNRDKDELKVLKRKRVWDRFKWWYNNQTNRLFKNHWLKDSCSMCKYEQAIKYREHTIQRRKDKKVINEQLNDMET
jgi:hypothetical protein